MQTPQVPLNDLSRYARHVGDELAACLDRVLRSGRYVLGDEVAGFERAFADYCGVAHCVGVGNGTDALELALRACGVSAGDAVIVCANAAMYGTCAVLALGATPVYADVDPEGLLTTGTVLAAIGSSPLAPRAMVATHLYGRLVDMPPMVELARSHGLALVEDCAQAHGARGADGRMAGSWGDAAAFSFYPTKNLGAIGDGGAVLSRDDGIAARVRQLRQYGWADKYACTVAGGRNSRLDEVQAACLAALLPDLDRRNARRIAIAARYSIRIRHERIRTPAGGQADVAHLYVVRSDRRDGLASHLARAGIGTAVHYPIPDYRQPAIAPRHAGPGLPMTEAACAEVLSLPCFPELTDRECDDVIAACNGWDGA
jgi:dTDP-4-amino-4,6-dideoxygalactose transaminase